MKTYIISAIFFTLLAGCGPMVYGQRMAKSEVCPGAETSKCVMNSGTVTPIYIERIPRYLALDDQNEPVYWQLLGREMTPDASPFVNYCGNVSQTNPLEAYGTRANISVIEEPKVEDAFSFTREYEDRFAATFAADLNAAMTAAGITLSTKREAVEAALGASLERASKSALSLNGVFEFVTLRPDVIASLTAIDTPPELEQCGQALRSGQTSIITALTGVRINSLTRGNELSREVTSNFDASLSNILTQSEIAALKTEFQSKLTEHFEADLSPTFQVLSISGFRPRN